MRVSKLCVEITVNADGASYLEHRFGSVDLSSTRWASSAGII